MIGLKDKYKDYFTIGAAVNPETVISEKDIIIDNFNSITCENQMKFGMLYDKDDNYNCEMADKLYEFAKSNGIKMRGHNFVWHNQTPWHIFDKSKEEVIEILKNHMIHMNERYGDVISCWDVINEAIEDKSSEFLRKSPWLNKLGEDYCKIVFKLAREVLPQNVQLFYNDYNEYVPEKREKIVALIKHINEEEKLVDGIGMQCHVNLYYPTLDLVRETIEMYASMGLRIHITEMDLSYFRFEDRKTIDEPDKRLKELHAKVYGDYFAMFREYKDYIDNVTLWGVSDRYTWLDYFPVHNRKNWPLLFDTLGNPKESYYQVIDF